VNSPARRLGYRFLGPSFDYILHLRPAEWPIMAGHTAVGYLLAAGITGALRGAHLGQALLGLMLWVVLLNGGTLAINSAFDRDEGDIGYLKAPPPVPRHLGLVAFAMMTAGQVLAFQLPEGFRWAYAICFGLSVVYSVPPFRLKAVAGADWLINMWGFGTLTPYAGYAVTGRSLDPAHALVLLAFCPLFASLYPLTQLYQFEEDRRRGDRTLALILGMRRSLMIALAAFVLAFGLLAAAGLKAGWGTVPADLLRWGGLALAALSWARVLGPWLARHETMTAAQHQAGMYAALGAWALTDVVVILGWGAYS
jgi:lycopene elongase/hydratase (dihydrobisanhydrobacterioruberin-forming)